ncbi:MAG: hypothetical protein IT168_20290 [Bryobacterales bacterium]|nr:hypothetical protein [Bryobacterales bacterium]
MSYFAVCTFDLKNANYDDYQKAYSDLAQIGLNKQLNSSQGSTITLPTTTTAGEFNGASAASVRDDLCNRVSASFSRRGFTSEIFISVGGDWGWGHRTT